MTVAAQRTIGPYKVLERLSEGGMGRVFLAAREGSTDVCVVKQLLNSLEDDQIAVKRFRREAHLASFLSHPNIARILDAGLEKGRFFVAYELIAGQTIEGIQHKLLEHRIPMPVEMAVMIAVGALDALEYAHDLHGPDGTALGIVHRDLSPRNVMVSYNGLVKLIDFGVAKGNMDGFVTEPGALVGTLRYMSPEQARGAPIDRRSDIFALCVVLHEMLTGRIVVTEGDRMQMLIAISSKLPPPPSTKNPQVSKALDDVILKGLALDRDERYQTARELRDALLRTLPRGRTPTQSDLGLFTRHLFPKEEQRMIELVEKHRRTLALELARSRTAEETATDDMLQEAWLNTGDLGPTRKEEASSVLDAPTEPGYSPLSPRR
jgi:eukaryotic-like serine/threonine-protein kinase